MAQPTYKHTYKICPVFEHNCSNYNIQILSESTVEIPCDDPKCIEFGIEEGSPNQCIEFLVTCLDCGSCPSQYYKKCFCTTKDDCSECQDCNQLGICEDKCKTTEFCKDDTCLECDDTHPCPPGKKCVGGKCVCPAGTKKDPQGRCVQCFPTDDLGKCRICVDGVITPIPCDGVCDESNGCVDCLNSNDCSKNTDGRNCCNNKQCGCCPGYVWSFEQNKCIIPPCVDEECGPCKKCGPNGCEPVTCPPGFKCDPNVDDCVPDPCNSAPCDNGTDCGPECGCKDKVCTECEKLSCEECAKALGCTCNPATGKCEKVNKCDDTPCVTKNDCSEDCGCDQSVCQECANYSCEECGKIPGCKCVNGVCQGDGDRGCKDTFKLEADKCKAQLKATLVKSSGCACSDITAAVLQTADVGGLPTLNVQFRKGSGVWDSLVKFDNTLSKSISDTEKLLKSGDIVLKKEVLNASGAVIKQVSSTVIQIGDLSVNKSLGIISVSDLSESQIEAAKYFRITVSVDNIEIADNSCSYDNGVIFSQRFDVQLTNTTAFPVLPNTAITPQKDWIKSYSTLKSSDLRDPLFIWYRSKDSTYSDSNIIKRKYIAKSASSNTYVDTLTLDEGFLPKFDYRVENDCSCEKVASLDNVVVCEDKTLDYKLSNCNKKIELLKDLTYCDASNWKLPATLIGKPALHPNTLGDLEYAQIKFYLELNGTIVETLEADATGKLKLAGKMFEVQDANGITSLRFYTKDAEDKEVCIYEQTFTAVNNPLPSVQQICDTGVVKALFSGANISKVKYNGVLYNIGTSFVLTGDGEQIFTVIYTNGCELEYKHIFTCCDSRSLTISKNNLPISEDSVVTGVVNYNVTKLGFSDQAQITVTPSDNTVILEGNILGVNADLIASGSSVDIKITAVENGCEKTASLLVTKQTITISVTPNSCSEGVITVIGDQNQPFTLSYLNTSTDYNLNSEGRLEIPTKNTTSPNEITYTITKYKGVDVSGLFVKYTKLGTPSLTTVTLENFKDCTTGGTGINSVVRLKVSGSNLSESTVVTYEIGSSTYDSTLKREGNNFFLEIPNSNVDLLTLTVVKLENQGCPTTVNNSFSFELKQLSIVQAQGSCDGSTGYKYILSSTDADTINISGSLPVGTSYDPSTKTLKTGFDSNFTISVTTTKSGITRCAVPITISSPSGSNCECLQANVTVSKNNVCRITTPIQFPQGSHTFKVENNNEIIFDFTSLTNTTINIADLNFKVKAPNFGGSVDVTLVNPVFTGNVLRIKQFHFPNSLLVPYTNTIELFVTFGVLGEYCAVHSNTITTGPLSVNNVTYLESSILTQTELRIHNSNYDVILNKTLAELDINKVYIHLPASSNYYISFAFLNNTNIASIPSNFEILVANGSSNLTFSKDNISSSSTRSVNLDAGFDISVRSGGCYSKTIDNVSFSKGSGSPIYIKLNNNVVYGNVEFCRNQTTQVFTHQFSGMPGVETTWVIMGVTSTDDTFYFDPSDLTYTAGGLLNPILLTVVKDGIEYTNNGLVYISLKNTSTLNIVYNNTLNDNTGPYTLPVPSGVSGSWKNSSDVIVTNVDTTALSPGNYTYTFYPTGCYFPFVANITIQAVGTLNITGPASDCESVKLQITVPESGTLWYSIGTFMLGTVPPTSSGVLSSVSVSTGVNNLEITTTGNYNFVFLPNSNPTPGGYSAVKTKSVTVNAKTNLVDDGSIPDTLLIGKEVALPTTVSGVSGVWKLNNVVVTQINNTTSDGVRVYVFEPNGCFNNFSKSVTIVCPTDKTISLAGLSDECSASLGITSDFYNSFTTLINNSIVVTGTTLARASFTQPVNTIQITASKTGTTCQKVFNYTYNKCATCVLGVCDQCSGNSDTVVTVLSSSPFTNNSLSIQTTNNIVITGVSKTSGGAVSALITSQASTDKTVVIYKSFTNPCGDAGLDTVTLNYDVIINTPSGTVNCPKTFSYSYTIPAPTYIALDSLSNTYAIQDSNWVQISGYGTNVTYNSHQSFTVSGPDLVDNTVEFVLELLADNYAAVSVNGNAVGSVGISGSNNTSGFTSVHQFTIDKADLIAGTNSIEIVHYNSAQVMGLYIKIYRVVNESIDSTIYNARTALPILDC